MCKSIKVIFVFSIFSLITSLVFSQKKEIQTEEDYIILNKTLAKYFEGKKISDSLFYSIIYNDSLVHVTKKEERLRKQLDTVYIKKIADQSLYNRFFNENALWRREKRYQKFKNKLDTIFSHSELKNYKKQLNNHDYYWDKYKICCKNKVFVLDDDLIGDEININLENTKSKDFVRNRLFTFSKPLYSINKRVVLIAYSFRNNYLLYIYKKKHNKWQFVVALSENWMVDHVD